MLPTSFWFSWLSDCLKPRNFFRSTVPAGGSSTIASLLPTKTLAFGGDIWPDQPDVPAFFNLPFFRRWQPAKPRTGVTTVVFDFESDVWTWFYSNRNHRSIFSTETIARQFSQEIPVRLPQSAFYFLQCSSTISQNWALHWLSQVAELFIWILESWYLILTGDMSICRMSIEHQLLTLFFHWTLDGLGFCFWGRCHDRCIPQQNSRSCFSSSVCVWGVIQHFANKFDVSFTTWNPRYFFETKLTTLSSVIPRDLIGFSY